MAPLLPIAIASAVAAALSGNSAMYVPSNRPNENQKPTTEPPRDSTTSCAAALRSAGLLISARTASLV
jgi:hypothetical protein